ncbi:hypothetical protein ARMSODRAFT_969128 [Armillaria solidipes]|uniref:Heterokaryon incompatibility domain-containing protein n=1 Tax=Armillaria solidipes TaxID=1076256 RepID=A0A2H3BZX8_9AGAR|nr:hypothetical protein ARMSODRAFT_969128 [Armillaria solidipes]
MHRAPMVLMCIELEYSVPGRLTLIKTPTGGPNRRGDHLRSWVLTIVDCLVRDGLCRQRMTGPLGELVTEAKVATLPVLAGRVGQRAMTQANGRLYWVTAEPFQSGGTIARWVHWSLSFKVEEMVVLQEEVVFRLGLCSQRSSASESQNADPQQRLYALPINGTNLGRMPLHGQVDHISAWYNANPYNCAATPAPATASEVMKAILDKASSRLELDGWRGYVEFAQSQATGWHVTQRDYTRIDFFQDQSAAAVGHRADYDRHPLGLALSPTRCVSSTAYPTIDPRPPTYLWPSPPPNARRTVLLVQSTREELGHFRLRLDSGDSKGAFRGVSQARPPWYHPNRSAPVITPWSMLLLEGHDDKDDLVRPYLGYGSDDYEETGHALYGASVFKLLHAWYSLHFMGQELSLFGACPMFFEDADYPFLPEVTISAFTETGIAEGSIVVAKQRAFTSRKPVISSRLADTPCATFGTQGLLDKLNTTLGTSYRLYSLDNPFLSSFLDDCITNGYDFGMAYSCFRRIWYTDNWSTIQDKLCRQEKWDREKRQKALVGHRIVSVWLQPRRVWDLYSNRVVPYWMMDIDSEDRDPRPISHAWMDEKDRAVVWTPINGYEWPVPIPKDADLNLIRIEMLNLGLEYAWLDVLCLRQVGGRREDLRTEEWKLDVPTIGAVYQLRDVVCYLSGLGRPLTLKEDVRGHYRRLATRG